MVNVKSPSGRAALLVALLATGVQLAAAWVTQQVPTTCHLVGDAAGYWQWAQRIAAGDWLGHEGFYQAPLYPYLLALLMTVVGEVKVRIIVAQALMVGAAAGLLTHATARLFDRRAGWTAGLLVAFYPPAIFAGLIIQKSALDLLLTSALVWLIGHAPPRPGARIALALGTCCGLLALTRENALLWVPLCGIFIWQATRRASSSGAGRRAGAVVAAFIVGCLLVLGPVAARNRYVAGEWTFTTFQSGPNFYIGNSAAADGRYRPLVRGHETPYFERDDARRLAEQDAGRELSAREVSAYWHDRARQDIAADPLRWLRLLGYKLLLAVNRYEIADAESLAVYAEYAGAPGVLTSLWHFGVLAPLAVAGWVVSRKRRGLWIFPALAITMLLSVALFFVLGRYRLPVVPLLIPFAGFGIVQLFNALRTRRWADLLRMLIPAALVAVVCNVPVQDESRLDALAWMNAGVAAAEGGDLPAATICFVRAVEDHPQSPEANYNLALALAVQGRFEEAAAHYAAALRGGAVLPGLHYNYAVALENLGQLPDALRHYQQAVVDDAADAEARAAAQRLARQLHSAP